MTAAPGEPSGGAAAPGGRRPAVLQDLPVALTLFGSWFTILLVPVHIALGISFAVVVSVHLATRPQRVAALVRQARRPDAPRRLRLRLTADAVLVAAVAGVTVSGFLEWFHPEVEAYNGLHSFTSFLVIVFGIRHIWIRRKVLAARLRGRRRRARTPLPGPQTDRMPT